MRFYGDVVSIRDKGNVGGSLGNNRVIMVKGGPGGPTWGRNNERAARRPWAAVADIDVIYYRGIREVFYSAPSGFQNGIALKRI